MENIIKKEADFIIEEKFNDNKGIEKKAKIILSINYQLKKYSIYPIGSSNNDTFCFKSNYKENNQSNMWLAVTKAIQRAITFANQELENI